MKKELYSYTQDYINRWIISYADFVTVLLALFMVMYAFAAMNGSDLPAVLKNLTGKDTSEDVSSIPQQDYVYENKKRLEQIFSTTKVEVKASDVDSAIYKRQEEPLVKQFKNVDKVIQSDAVRFKNVESALAKKLANINGVKVIGEPRGLIIQLKDTVLFTSGSDIIEGRSQNVLNRVAEVLKDVPNSVRIEGHTDNLQLKSSRYPSNWELSTARATSVLRYFVKKHQISPVRLSAVGYGEYAPIADNDTFVGRNANRRVDIVVLSSLSKAFDPVIEKN